MGKLRGNRSEDHNRKITGVSSRWPLRSARDCPRTAKAVLSIMQAEDETVNPWSELRRDEERRSVGEQLLRHPNMNTTGRLPPFGMFHIGMRMRLIKICGPSRGRGGRNM